MSSNVLLEYVREQVVARESDLDVAITRAEHLLSMVGAIVSIIFAALALTSSPLVADLPDNAISAPTRTLAFVALAFGLAAVLFGLWSVRTLEVWRLSGKRVKELVATDPTTVDGDHVMQAYAEQYEVVNASVETLTNNRQTTLVLTGAMTLFAGLAGVSLLLC